MTPSRTTTGQKCTAAMERKCDADVDEFPYLETTGSESGSTETDKETSSDVDSTCIWPLESVCSDPAMGEWRDVSVFRDSSKTGWGVRTLRRRVPSKEVALEICTDMIRRSTSAEYMRQCRAIITTFSIDDVPSEELCLAFLELNESMWTQALATHGYTNRDHWMPTLFADDADVQRPLKAIRHNMNKIPERCIQEYLEHCRQQDSELGEQHRYFVVVGGKASGGILVRDASSIQSKAKDERLTTGSIVKQLRQVCGRMRYWKISGSGPETGWVSMAVGGKPLLEVSAGPVPNEW